MRFQCSSRTRNSFGSEGFSQGLCPAFTILCTAAFRRSIGDISNACGHHDILKLRVLAMGRNLYILAGTLGGLSLLSIVLSFTNIAEQPGSPGDASLWRMTSIALLCVALIVTLLGVLSSLFEQAERRASLERQERQQKRRRRE
jgi:hypothetical protein